MNLIVAEYTFQRLPTRLARAAIPFGFWLAMVLLVPAGASWGGWRRPLEWGLLLLVALALLSFRRVRITAGEGIRVVRILLGLPIRTTYVAAADLDGLFTDYLGGTSGGGPQGYGSPGMSSLAVVDHNGHKTLVWEGTDDGQLHDLFDLLQDNFELET